MAALRVAALALVVVLPGAAAGAERTFTLVSVNGSVPAAQQVLRVTKGDAVILNFTSNKPGEIHLHGYRREAKLAPGKTATWRFTAHATGRFRLEWHGTGDTSAQHHGPPLATLEVLPK